MVSAAELTKKIKAEAYNLGFVLFGVTQPVIPPHINTYKEWVTNLQYAGMAYLASDAAIQRRENPGLIMEGCQSILVLGFPYPGPFFLSEPKDDLPRGRIASYAWGKDYHIDATEKAQLLTEYIRTLSQFRFRIYVDTGPILERDMAQLAGLGWIGKNTCLISPQQGSYFFLIEIFTDLVLEPTTAFTADRCGNCRRCIEICPTGCILPNRTLDAKRCISYLTIENKGPIPLELRHLTGNWIFGCDLCQVTCPWNKKHHHQPGDRNQYPNQNIAYPNLLEEIQHTPREFNSKYRHSPVSRARRRGYLRNIATALGNRPQPDFLPTITSVLSSESESLIREHLYWTLGQMGTPEAGQVLEKFSQIETDPAALAEIARCIKNQF